MASEQRLPCRYFQTKGSCFYGNDCKFWHEGVSDKKETVKLGAQAPAFVPSSDSSSDSQLRSSSKAFVPRGAQVAEFIPQGQAGPAPFIPAANAPSFEPAGNWGSQEDVYYTPEEAEQYVAHEGGRRPLLPIRREAPSFFVADTLRADLQQQNSVLVARLQPEDPRFNTLPVAVGGDRYHSLWPLPLDGPSQDNTYPGSMYKVTAASDGVCYALRRVAGCRLSEEFARLATEPWIALHAQAPHPHLVALREVFTTKDFGDISLCFVYDFFPGAASLQARYLSSHGSFQRVAEEVIWSFTSQLLAAVVSVHSAGLACRRSLSPQYIVVTDRHRLRLNLAGYFDALQRATRPLPQQQAQDLGALGHLILSLACSSSIRPEQMSQALDFVANNYSPELRAVLGNLLSPAPPTAFELAGRLAHRLLGEVQAAHSHVDYLHAELAKEVENGRLLRLLTKLNFITERPEHAGDQSWAETGDRYLLKLFRDFVFHQQQGDGSAMLDYGHVMTCLNKLDAGTEEKTLLVSRNEESMLAASYADLKRCVKEAFAELNTARVGTPASAKSNATPAQGSRGGSANRGRGGRPVRP